MRLRQTELDKLEEMHDWILTHNPELEYLYNMPYYEGRGVRIEKHGYKGVGHNILAAYTNLRDELKRAGL